MIEDSNDFLMPSKARPIHLRASHSWCEVMFYLVAVATGVNSPGYTSRTPSPQHPMRPSGCKSLHAMGFEPTSTNTLELESSPLDRSGTNAIILGPFRCLNAGPPAPKARIIPLDQTDTSSTIGNWAHNCRLTRGDTSHYTIADNAAGYEPTTFALFGIQCSANWATHPRYRPQISPPTINFHHGAARGGGTKILIGRTIIRLHS